MAASYAATGSLSGPGSPTALTGKGDFPPPQRRREFARDVCGQNAWQWTGGLNLSGGDLGPLRV